MTEGQTVQFLCIITVADNVSDSDRCETVQFLCITTVADTVSDSDRCLTVQFLCITTVANTVSGNDRVSDSTVSVYHQWLILYQTMIECQAV